MKKSHEKNLSELFKKEPKLKKNMIYFRITDEDLNFLDGLMAKYEVSSRSHVLRILLQDRIRQIKEGK